MWKAICNVVSRIIFLLILHKVFKSFPVNSVLFISVDCQWEEWNEWDSSQCSAPCGGKREGRIRIKQAFDGQDCSGDDTEERQCDVQDCQGYLLSLTNSLNNILALNCQDRFVK